MEGVYILRWICKVKTSARHKQDPSDISLKYFFLYTCPYTRTSHSKYPNHMFGRLWAGWCSGTVSTWNINATTKHTRVLLSFRILKFNLFPAVQCFDFIRLAISTQFDVAFIVMRSVCRSLTYGLSSDILSYTIRVAIILWETPYFDCAANLHLTWQ